jgi:AraC-like DNA-binding protein
MPGPSAHTLCERIGFSDGHGYHPTFLPEVTLFRVAVHEGECPLLHQSGLTFILQGHQVGSAGGREFSNGGDRYLILTGNLPLRCETPASNETPVIGLHLGIDVTRLQRLVSILSDDLYWRRKTGSLPEQVVTSSRLDEHISNSVAALIEVLHDPIASRAIGSATLTRLYFDVLRSEDGMVLASLTRNDSRLATVSAAMRYMEQHLHDKVGIEELVRIANMSRSAFHRAFKEVLGESPLQYLKQMRLATARNRITYEGQSVRLAAESVGYESTSQFSREFKRYFGIPPSRAGELPYSNRVGLRSYLSRTLDVVR